MKTDIKQMPEVGSIKDIFKLHPRIRKDFSFHSVPYDPAKLRELYTGKPDPLIPVQSPVNFSQETIDQAISEYLQKQGA